MKTNRRAFFSRASLAGGALALVGAAPKSFIAKPPKIKLGTVTYNLAKDWDLDTIIKNCEEAKFEGVELRTTHAHKVEVSLTASEREAVRKRFHDSDVELMGLGSAFDYHTPDQAQLRKDIEATKEYVKLAHDVGASGVKVRPNGFPKGVSQERTLEQIGKALREVGQFGDSHGIQIRLEIHGSGTCLLPNIKTIMDVADHPNVGVCWNSNSTDLEGKGFDYNFDLVKNKIFTVHLRDLYLDDYPFRHLFQRLNDIGFTGYCLAEIPDSKDSVRVMKYFRSLFLAYQDLL